MPITVGTQQQAAIQQALFDRAQIQSQIEALQVGKDGTPRSNPAWAGLIKSRNAADVRVRSARSAARRAPAAPFNPALSAEQAQGLVDPQAAAAQRVISGAVSGLRSVTGGVRRFAGRVGRGTAQRLQDPGRGRFGGEQAPPPPAPEQTPAEAAAAKPGALGLRPGQPAPRTAPGEGVLKPTAAAPAPEEAAPAPEVMGPPEGPQGPPEEIPEFGIGQQRPEDVPPTDKHFQKADVSPEIAAFKEAIEAPAPVFAGLAFSTPERLALGFLAGLRGLKTVLPIIEMRRRDARFAYQAARQARADRIREAESSVNVATQQQRFQEDVRRFDEGVSQEDRRFGLAEDVFEQRGEIAAQRDATTRRGQDLMFRARADAINARLGRLSKGRSITATQQGRVAKLYRTKAALNNVIALIMQANPDIQNIEDADIPGTPLLFGVALPGRQQQFKAAWQRASAALRRELLGAAQTYQELVNTDAFIASFGSLNSKIINGILQVEQDINSAMQGELRTMTAGGFDTEALELDAEDFGFFGRMPGPRTRAPIIPGVGGIDMIPEDWVEDVTEILEE